MRATVRTEEFQYVAGIFKRVPRWKVICTIEFTPEELAIIRQRNLGSLYIYTQHINIGSDVDVRLAEVVKDGIWSICHTPVDAKNVEHEIVSEILPTLKNYLSASADVEGGTRVLEF